MSRNSWYWNTDGSWSWKSDPSWCCKPGMPYGSDDSWFMRSECGNSDASQKASQHDSDDDNGDEDEDSNNDNSDEDDDTNGGDGGGNITRTRNGTEYKIKMLLLGATGYCIDGKDFKRKWRERYGADLVLPHGVRLKAYLEGFEAAGACRIEMRPMPKGPVGLLVHAPRESNGQGQAVLGTSPGVVYEVGDRVIAKYSSTSRTWKLATVMNTPQKGDPFIWFDGYDDAIRIPLERIRKLQAEPSTPQQPILPALPPDSVITPFSLSVVKTTFEKALWLVQFEANQKKLASATFDGVSVCHKGSSLEVFVRNHTNDEQNQAATELVAALKEIEANVKVSDPFSLPEAAVDKLGGDLDLKRLEREQRVLVIRPKNNADSASTDAPAGLRLVGDESSDLERVQEYLIETYTSVTHKVALPYELARLPDAWLKGQILQPTEAHHHVKMSLIRASSKEPFEGGNDGGGGGIGNFTPTLNDTNYNIKMLLQRTPECCIDEKDFKRKWRERYGADLGTPDGVSLRDFLKDSAAAGACRLETRPMPNQGMHFFSCVPWFNSPDSLIVHAAHDGSGGKGGGGEVQVKGVPSRVARAIVAIEDAMHATQVEFLENESPLPELVEEVHKMRNILLSSGDDECGDESGDSITCVGKLLILVFAPSIPGVPPPFVKVTLAIAPSAGGNREDSNALKEAHEKFQALFVTFDKTMFCISDEFPRQIDATAATSELENLLGGPGKSANFAANCGLVKVEWNKYRGEVLLVGDITARKIGVKSLESIGNGAKFETVRLSWPEGRLFRGLFGFDAAQGAAALSRLHAAIKSVNLPSGITVDVGNTSNPVTYAVVRGGSVRVAAVAEEVRTAVEAFVRKHVTTQPISGLAPDEEAFLITRPQALISQIESTYSVVVDFSAGNSHSGGSQKPRLLLETTGEHKGTKVRVLHGDLLFSKCGAIVNAANGQLAHSGGVAAAIATAAGPACDAECRKVVRDAGGVLPVGIAVRTGAGAVLNARGTTFVVHAVVPAWSNGSAVLLMCRAVQAALVEAEIAGASEVAIPLCGSGIYGWPASRAAEVVMSELVAYAANPATKLTSLNLVDFEAPKAAAAADALSNLCGAAPKAADATSAVPLPEHQWYFECPELSSRGDGFQPYDYDQNQQVEAAWAAFANGGGASQVTIIGDAGGTKSNSLKIPQGKTAAEYVIYFKSRVEDSCQMNVASKFKRQLKREKCTEPPPLFSARVAEAARVLGDSGGGRFHITHDGRGRSLMQSGGDGSGRTSVSVRGFTRVARAGAKALVRELRTSKCEKELNLDEAETPAHKLLVDLQEAAAADGATVELVAGKQRAVVRAFGNGALKAAYGACAAVRDQARKNARAPPSGWVKSAKPPTGASFALTSVVQGSAEWKGVASAVAKTMPTAKLTRLKRVQNRSVWDDYAQRRSEVAKKSSDGFSANEVWCFHGTSSFPVANVCETGLDFRHGSDGSMWGRALYIAVNASYSDAYSSDAGNGERQFFYVRAALGRSVEVAADKSICAPPPTSWI